MAYAKLSGALLVRKDAPVEETVSAPMPAPPPSEVPHAAPHPHPVAPRPDPEAERLLAEHLKELNLSVFLGEFDKLARQAAEEGIDHEHYLLRLVELELAERKRQMSDRRIKAAHFPAVKDLDSFDFAAVPSLDGRLVTELARCEYVKGRENVIILGNSGTGKTHVALGLGLAACREGHSVGFVTAAAIVNQMVETRYQWRLLRLQKRLAAYNVLIIDELGYVPLPDGGGELLFEVISQRHERGSTIITSNLALEEWNSVFGTSQLTGAVLDRLTHHVHMLEMTGESYRLKHSVPAVRGNGYQREEFL